MACKKCLKCFKYDSHKTGTSHLKRHVEHCISSTSQSSGRQLKLPFKNCGVARQAKSDALNAAVSVVVKDLRPFSVFDGEGMKEFAQTCIDIRAKYGKLTVEEVLPSRNTIAKKVKSTALDQKTNLLASLKLAISNNSGFGVTSDLWTDDFKKLTYLSCTAHWLENRKRKNSGIFCKLFQAERKTAENIRHKLVINMTEVGLEESMLKNITFVTDRGANIKKALECFFWLPCCCHVLNVILYHAFKMKLEGETSASVEIEAYLDLDEVIVDGHAEMEQVRKLMEAVKDLVTYLKRSGLASQLSSTVIQDIETRWNSKLAMLISVNEIFGEIQTLFKQKNQDDRLRFIDVVLIKDLIQLLTPFKSISMAMETDKYPTLHGVLLWKKKLLLHCQRVHSDSLVIKCLKSNLTSLIKKNGLTSICTR